MHARHRVTALLLSISITLVLGIAKAVFSAQLTWTGVGLTLVLSLIITTLFAIEDLRYLLQSEVSLLEAAKQAGLTSQLTELAVSYTKVGAWKDPLFSGRIQQALDRLGVEVRQASTGVLILTGSDELTNYVIRIMKETQRSLDATTIWSEDSLFKTSRGRSYKQAAKEAIVHRHVTIRRLYLLDELKDVQNAKLRRSVNEDLEMRVQVRWGLVGQWESGARKMGAPEDFGLFDSVRLWVYQRTRADKDRSALLSVDPVQVASYKEMFDANWESAEEFEQEQVPQSGGEQRP